MILLNSLYRYITLTYFLATFGEVVIKISVAELTGPSSGLFKFGIIAVQKLIPQPPAASPDDKSLKVL